MNNKDRQDIKKLFKLDKGEKTIIRQFINTCYILDKKGIDGTGRYNLYEKCMMEAADSPENKILIAQKLFVEKAQDTYPELLKGEKI